MVIILLLKRTSRFPLWHGDGIRGAASRNHFCLPRRIIIFLVAFVYILSYDYAYS